MCGKTVRDMFGKSTPSQVTVSDMLMPALQARTDAIVSTTPQGICGTDLHKYHGLVGSNARWVMGNEGLG